MKKTRWGDKDKSYEKHTLGPRRGTNQKHSLHHIKKIKKQEERQEGYGNDGNVRKTHRICRTRNAQYYPWC